MAAEAKVIEATTSNGKTIWSLQLKYWRAIHGELMTHRVFSRNASSSRAIPVMKTLKQVWSDPAMPVHWGQNQPGMQARSQLSGWKLKLAKKLWTTAGKLMCIVAWLMVKLDLHKQVANRILEPWQYIHVIVTATEFDNFFELRDHEDAQPEFQELARKISQAMADFTPRNVVTGNFLCHRAWHLPYVTPAERMQFTLEDCLKFSAARCARVSYALHDGKATTPEKDRQLYETLVGSAPRHSSPVEHQAVAFREAHQKSNNFVGWEQHREIMERRYAASVKS